MMMLLLRKVLIAFAVGFTSVFVLGAPGLIDLFEKQDWSTLGVAAWALAIGAVAGGLRALLALLTAFVPTDADVGFNVVGRYRHETAAPDVSPLTGP